MADFSDAKKRRLAVLDSKLSGIQKKFKDRPSHQEANDKSEVALQAHKKSDSLRKGTKVAQGGPSTLPSQPSLYQKQEHQTM
ncbi:g8136 [Coccomyxa elongata]